jgi:ligand-binding SRPBCC domain-containing protein
MSTYQFEQVQFIPRPRSEVFRFFADAANLERITPSFLHFRILSELPIEMKAGALIDYRLSLYGLPVYWRTRIETFQPEVCFSDIQLKGPYRRWHHVHEFLERDGGTEMHDRVSYELPLGPLGALARALFVRRSLEQIFAHRRAVVSEIFGS